MNAQFDFLAHLARQAEFSGRVFGPGIRTKGVIDHIKKELVEIEQAPTDITEWIDVVILALDGAWRAGASPQQIIDTLVAKQTRNESRTWPDWRTADPDKAICHVKAAPPEGILHHALEALNAHEAQRMVRDSNNIVTVTIARSGDMNQVADAERASVMQPQRKEFLG